MGIFDRFRSKQPVPEKDLFTDVGYIESPIYGGGNIPTYNPDFIAQTKGAKIYDQMLRDEQVKAIYRFRRDTTTGRRWAFKFDDEQREVIGDQEADFRINVFTQAVKNAGGSFKQSMDSIMSAMAYGFSMTNKVYELFDYDSRSWYGIKRLRRKPYHTFYFYLDEFGNQIKIEQQVDGRRIILDKNRFIHYVRNPDIDENYGRSELYEAYRAWFSKDITIRFLNIHMERCASGFNYLTPTGDVELKYGTPAYNRLVAALESVRNNSSVVWPKGYEFTSVMPKDNKGFETAIAMHDKAIAKTMLVPNLLGLSEQGDTGSYSQSQTQLEAFLWMLDADATGLAEVLDEQLFYELGELNFGDGAYPCFHLLPLSQAQVNEVIKVWTDLVTAGAVEASDTDEEQIRTTLGMPEKGEALKKPQPVVNPSALLPEGETKDDETDDDAVDETIVGSKSVAIDYARRFSVAVRRVDFAALDRNSDLIVIKHSHLMSEAVSNMLKDAVSVIEEKQLGTENSKPEDIAKFNFSASNVKEVRNVTKAVLKEGWNLGQDNAAREIKVALKRETKINFVRLSDIAAKYFDARSFIMAGNITDKSRAMIKEILMNGIRYSKSVEQIRNEIYKKFAKEGMISKALVEQALGEVLGVDNPNYRLDTIIKTNTFEAINEARYSFFNDPDLGGYVEALEYSAVMDSRTTPICQELDGHIHAADSDIWAEGYRPPNHYNCRSVLVPVLRGDEWQESERPSLSPLEGFA